MVVNLPLASCALDYTVTWNVIKDVGVLFGTGFAIYVGWRGFTQWRFIEWAKTDFDVSRRLLTSVFKTRDWFNNARRPMILMGEFPDGYDLSEPSLDKKRDAYFYAFNNRFQPLRDCCVELQSLRCEAEATWDAEIATLVDELLACCKKLETSMGMYVRMIGEYVPSGGRRPEEQFERAVLDIPTIDLSTNKEVENKSTAEIRKAVERIESYVRDKQQRNVKTIRPRLPRLDNVP